MISSRLPDRSLRFHSSKCTVAFLSRNVSILHTLTPVSDFSDEQRETNIQLLLQVQVELGFPNGNGRHRYKSRLVKWLTFQLELGSFSYGNGRHMYKLLLVKWLTLENERKLPFLKSGGIRRKNLDIKVLV